MEDSSRDGAELMMRPAQRDPTRGASEPTRRWTTTGNGTTVIKTGDRLRVDGTGGSVEILGRASAEAVPQLRG
jgi:hypothetical protein